MKIADRTPFRSESGEIDILGRAQGTLKYGLSWYSRLQAQDIVIAVFSKVLGPNYVLLRNVTLPNTDIDLPLVLIGPPGIYLINVLHENGVYKARDEEWGKVSGEKFVPAGINQVQRTIKFGRVLQIYLDREGYKGTLVVDPILMAADPGMHIESVRPALRIVMSDALERFAISMNQARSILSFDAIKTIAQLIVNGATHETSTAPFTEVPPTQASPMASGRDANETLLNPIPTQESSPAFSLDSLGFSFDDSGQDDEPLPQDTQISQPAAAQRTSMQNTASQNDKTLQQDGGFQESMQQKAGSGNNASQQTGAPTLQFGESSESLQAPAQSNVDGKPGKTITKKKNLFGMSSFQWVILGGILLLWLCAMAAFAVYIYTTSLNG
jgi:hypothetical protein